MTTDPTTQALTEAERDILLTRCECGHTINDHGDMAACWVCLDDNRECVHNFEALLIARVGAIVDSRVAARVAAARAEAVAGVLALHSQDTSLLAPGKWCPECGQETPCRTVKAILAPPEHLGHLSRDELSQRAMDYDEAEETALRRRESDRTHNLNHAPLPDGVLLDPGFCAGCDTLRAVVSREPGCRLDSSVRVCPTCTSREPGEGDTDGEL